MFPSSVNSQTRAERLCASLSRTFDTPKLATKESSIHEFIGPVASERYALLPPKSDAAAKALLAVGLKRGVAEVRLLENIRRRRGLPDLPSPRFDHFVSFMLQTPSPAFERCAEICDSYTPSRHMLELVPHTRSSVGGNGSETNSVFVANRPESESAIDLQQLQLSNDSDLAPNDSVVHIDAIHTPPTHFTPASEHVHHVKSSKKEDSEPIPLIDPCAKRAAEPLEKLTVDLKFNDQTGKVSLDLIFVPIQPVSEQNSQPFARIATLSTRARSQVKAANLATKHNPLAELNSTELPIAMNHNSLESHVLNSSPFDLKTNQAQQNEQCHVRPSAPALNITTLKDQIHKPPAPPSHTQTLNPKNTPQDVDYDSGEEVIFIGAGPKPPVRSSSMTASAKARKKRQTVLARRSTPLTQHHLFERRKRMKDMVMNALQTDSQPPNRIAPALLRNRRAAAKSSFQDTGLRRPKRRARPIAPMIDESDTDNEYRNQEIDDDFTPEVRVASMRPVATQEANSFDTERRPREENEQLSTRTSLQKAKHVRFSDEIEEMQIELDGGSPASRTRSRRTGGVARHSKSDNSPLPNEEEEILDSHDSVLSRRKLSKRSRVRKSLPQPARTRTHPSPTPLATGARNGQASQSKRSDLNPISFDHISDRKRPSLWDEDLRRFEEELKTDDVDSLTSDEDSDTPAYIRMPLVQHITKRMKDKSITFEDLDNINPEEEIARCYEEVKDHPPYAPESESPGLKFIEDCLKQMLGNQSRAISSFGTEDVHQHHPDDEEEDDIETGSGRKIYRGSSDSSDPLESSDEGDGENGGLRVVVPGGSKRSRREARSRASKARELQGRVCGDLLPTMTFEARRRVLRWAERDFTWFDSGCDFMEIVAARTSKRCNRCNMPGDDDLMCEESILLKLWKDMSWRKVRRMRHRHSER
eukprot:TRINITY_DN42_c0_g1_i1.p1 TRINITY_DN42_c0_g1~~TRINITY_DN42_c0_g1_i1.p1  ORF type:complete len:929 (-),score=117.70 TRINITY_DN42_c0_g1_i1:8683-11469(-)